MINYNMDPFTVKMYYALVDILDRLQRFVDDVCRLRGERRMDSLISFNEFAKDLRRKTGATYFKGEAFTVDVSKVCHMDEMVGGEYNHACRTERHCVGSSCRKEGYNHTAAWSKLMVYGCHLYHVSVAAGWRTSMAGYIERKYGAQAYPPV